MKKNIKTILSGIFMIPLIALGISAFAPLAQPANAEYDSIQQGASDGKTDEQSSNLFGDDGVFKIITNTALFLIGAISVIMLIYGGITYTLSAGDSTKVTNAKNTIMYAIIGIVVALLAYAIVNFVLGQLVK